MLRCHLILDRFLLATIPTNTHNIFSSSVSFLFYFQVSAILHQMITHPFLYANKWSRIFHSWISELINLSHKQGTLYLHNLYEILPEYQSKILTEKLEQHWLDEVERYSDRASLLRVTVRTMGWKPFLIGWFFMFAKLADIIQPLLIVYLMDFFEPCSTMSIRSACFLASLSFIAVLCSRFGHHRFYYLIEIFAMQMRVAYHGLIYRKVLRLSSRSLNGFGLGATTNIFSNDASQIEMAVTNINYLWITLVDIVAMIIFFWYFIKYISLIAIGYTIVIVLLTSLFGHFIVHFRKKILQVTDERVKIMSEIIKSMRIVKMYCWETPFEEKIRRVRKREIIRYTFRLIFDTIQMMFSYSYVCITFLIIYGTMWALDVRFDIRFFAVASCLIGYIELSVMEFAFGMHDFVNYLTAEKRMTTFLLLDETERDNRLLSTSLRDMSNMDMNHHQSVETTPKVICNLQQAYWDKNQTFSLRNIVFDAHPGDLICVIGPVGSGKSSLLQTLTGEIGFFDGKVRLSGSYCYVPQESWIFSSTVKSNILFGKEYNQKLFQRVIHATALDTDFAQLSHGADTLVGDQGVMLSGGQKARVNMARALYRDADIYLLDDPLSAVDAKVSKHLFEKSIKGYLQKKICILVTHQIQFLQDATKIIVLDNGEMVQMGTYEELLTSSPAFSRLLDNVHQQKQQEHSGDMEQERSMQDVTSTGVDDEEEPFLMQDNLEVKEKGAVKWRVYVEYIRAGVGLTVGLAWLIVTCSIREAVSVFSSWWLAEWSEDESYRYLQLKNCSGNVDQKINTIQSMTDTQWNHHRDRRFYFSCGIALLLVIFTLFRTVTVRFMCLNASRVLHNQMFRRVIRCPISFFDFNPIGRILNRFTKDVAIIDEQLPAVLYEFSHCFCQVLGLIALVSWLNPWSFIPAAVAATGMIYIRYRYTRCSRDLKRLEGTTRSPFYSYLTSTIDGLKVIRSYHAERVCSSEFFFRLDKNTRAHYLLLTTNRWAAIRFDWITLFFVIVVTLLAILVRVLGQQFSPADIALILAYSLHLMGLLQWTIRQSVEVETQMTSVERILQYCSLEQEPPAQSPSRHRPPTNWPTHGHIVFDDVSMSHSNHPHSPLALHHISLVIHAAQKIGIVGRTGAGKSSFIQSLFRMGTLVHGHIIIDDIDIATIGLDDLRSRISIIPQDPVLFTGTIKTNLDRFARCSDTEIWNALEQVQLKRLVRDVLPNGLESLVSEGGSNLSVGQKQLICLARAILKKSRILVIDEATANVDNVTDELIQRAIRDAFEKCTVLTVAHRLRTVIDSDRIMVLSEGRVVEYDVPGVLLSDRHSYFTSLVEQTGATEAEHFQLLRKQGKNPLMNFVI